MQAMSEQRSPLVYRIHFCDRATCIGSACSCYQHCSPISPPALQHVLGEVPTLESILYGHPNMMPLQNNEQDHLGICRLYLHPDFAVVREDFEVFVRCLKAAPFVQPPALTNLMPVAILVAEKFGGCAVLDEYQHRLDGFHTIEERIPRNPALPVQDVDSLYDWRTLGPITDSDRAAEDTEFLKHWQDQGFELAQFCTPSHSPTHYLILRRRKTTNGRPSCTRAASD